MKLKLNLILFFFLCCSLFSQQSDLQQLESALAAAAGAEQKLKILNRLYNLTSTRNFDKTIEYCNQAIQLSRSVNNIQEQSNAYFFLGKCYGMLGEPTNSIKYLDSSLTLKIRTGDKKGEASCYNGFANNYKTIGEETKALEFHLKALKIRESLADSLAIASSLNNIGIIYKGWGLYTKALEYYQRTISIAESGTDKDLLANAYKNVGNIYLDMKRTEEANEHYLKALKLNYALGNTIRISSSLLDLGNIMLDRKKLDSAMFFFRESYLLSLTNNAKEQMSNALVNIGVVFKELNQPDSALFYYKNGLNLAEKSELTQVIASTTANMADIYIKKNDFAKAKQLLDKSMKISIQHNFASNIIELYHNFSKYYEKTGDFKKALEYNNKYIIFKDSVFNDNIKKRIQEMQFGYDFENKERQIEILKKDNELLENNEKYHKIVAGFLYSVSAFILILGIFIFILYRSKSSANNELKIMNLEISRSKDELAILNSDKDKYLAIIQSDIAKASDYIFSLIPKKIDNDIIKTDWMYIPCSKLGGDAFGYNKIDDEHISIYLLDVSGHGTGAALHSVAALNTLKFRTLPETDFREPSQVLSKLNSAFRLKEHNNTFFTIWYGVYNIKSRLLKYSSAGHPPALLVEPSGKSMDLSTKNLFIGSFLDVDYLSHTVSIPKDSLLYIFSDGVYEIRQQDGIIREMENLREFLVANRDYHSSEDLVLLLDDITKITGSNNFEDDFSLLKILFR